MSATAGVEPTTFRLKAIDSTKAPLCPMLFTQLMPGKLKEFRRNRMDLSYSGMRTFPVESDAWELGNRSSTCLVSSETDQVSHLPCFLIMLFNGKVFHS